MLGLPFSIHHLCCTLTAQVAKFTLIDNRSVKHGTKPATLRASVHFSLPSTLSAKLNLSHSLHNCRALKIVVIPLAIWLGDRQLLTALVGEEIGEEIGDDIGEAIFKFV